jgi:hypothetical protein
MVDLATGTIETVGASGSDFVWSGDSRLYGLTGDELVRLEVADGQLGSVEQLGEIDHNVNERGLDVVRCRADE